MNNPQSDILYIGSGEDLLLIGRIGQLESLIAAANEEERASVEGFTSPSRIAERLAWRIMVREVLGRDITISYSDSGAPSIQDSQYKYISVSHCADRVAVLLSQRPCGLDIELTGRNFDRVATRYMNPDEQTLASTPTERAAVWCAKECLYKMAGISGLDLRLDIRIESIDLAAATITGCVKGGEPIAMRIMMPDSEHIAVYHT